MAHVLSLVSSKGGTGKTTTALNLSVALAELGHRTVLIDLDPQGSIGLALARGDTEWPGLADHLADGSPLAASVKSTKLANLDILPRGRLDPVDTGEYETYLHGSGLLRGVVDELAADRTYLVLDCPSGLGLITRAALAVSSFALVPLQAEHLALRSFTQTLRVLNHVQSQENPGLRLLGVLPTMVMLHKEPSMNVMGTIWSEINGVLDTAIPRAEIFMRASELGLPVSFLAGPVPPEARRFDLLASEIESIIGAVTGDPGGDHEPEHRQLV